MYPMVGDFFEIFNIYFFPFEAEAKTTKKGGGARYSRRPHHHALSCFPTHPWRSSILHGEDFPRTLMRGEADGAVEPARHRQETLDLAA